MTIETKIENLYKYCTPWKGDQPSSIDPAKRVAKTFENLLKALNEHQGPRVATREEIITSFTPQEDSTRALSYQPFGSENQGKRDRMEDEFLAYQIDEGLLLGVFDGHGGIEVASFAKGYTESHFSNLLKETRGDIPLAFNMLFQKMHEELLSLPYARNQGSTAVISFLDPVKHSLYTATLGDSETVIYRKIEGRWKAIPVSCKRDWSSPKDALRFGAAWGDLSKVKALLAINPNPKILRYPSARGGVNTSRALGDLNICQGNMIDTSITDIEVVSHKPKITSMMVNSGDLIVSACDGLFDFVTQEEIALCLETLSEEADVTEALVKLALEKGHGQDNVTVVALKVT